MQKLKSIRLTTINSHRTDKPVSVWVDLDSMIAYGEQQGFTNLRLSGRKELRVLESTAEIDRRVRLTAQALANWEVDAATTP